MTKHIKMIFIFFLITIAGLTFNVWRNSQADSALITEQALKEIIYTVTNRLQGNLDYIELLGQVRKRNELTPENFEERAMPYLQAHPEFINFTWVDNDFYIKGVAPMEGNSHIIGLHVDLAEPARVSLLAKNTRQARYTTAFEAIQGDCSFEVWVPVFKQNDFLGLFAGVYSCQRLLEETVHENVFKRFAVTITDDSGAILASMINTEKSTKKDLASLKFDIGNNMMLTLDSYQDGLLENDVMILLGSAFLLCLFIIFSIIALQYETSRRIAAQNNLKDLNNNITSRLSQELKPLLVTLQKQARFIRLDIDKGSFDDTKSYVEKINESSIKMEKIIDDITKQAAHSNEGSRISRADTLP